MGDARHTPGPWSVRPDPNDDWGIVRAADGRPVADAGVSPRTDEFRDREDVPSHEWEAGPPEVAANARLIAASPTLLAACEEWVAYLDDGDAVYSDEETAMIRRMRAAVARAKGN